MDVITNLPSCDTIIWLQLFFFFWSNLTFKKFPNLTKLDSESINSFEAVARYLLPTIEGLKVSVISWSHWVRGENGSPSPKEGKDNLTYQHSYKKLLHFYKRPSERWKRWNEFFKLRKKKPIRPKDEPSHLMNYIKNWNS